MSSASYRAKKANLPGKLNVLSVFLTVDGECNYFHQGSLSVFVRLTGCRVGCVYCFGQKEGKRHPEVHLASGGKKKLSKVRVGDVLLTLDESHALVQTTVTETHNRRVTEWIEVKIKNHTKLDSTTFFVTPEHPFFTTRGQVCAEDLKVGDDIYHVSPNEIISYYKRGSRNPNYKETIPRNPNYDKLKSQNKLEEGSCLLCGNLSTLEVHHKDGDRTNDAESNLTSLCHPCHSKLHQRGANFWNGNRADNKRSYAELNHNGAKVLKVARVSRDPKINWKANGMTSDLPVFNISCAPHNTYLLNTMWVHNCDTKYSWPLNQGAQLSPLEVLSKIRDIGGDCRKVTITGGEPLEQDGKEFMDLLILLTSVGYSVTIETAGVVSFAHLKDIPSVSLVVDLKTPSALPTGNKLVYSPLTEEMSLLSDRHFIKCVISSLDDFNWALGWVNILRGSGCRARIFFSPDHTAMTGVQLFEYIKASSLCQKFNVGLNLQLHKYLFPADYREEEYLNTGKGNESHENSSHGS